MYSGQGACRNASTRANASFTDVRGAEGLEARGRLRLIDTAAEMDAQRFRTNLVSEAFFYSKMFNPRWPHTPDEFTLERGVDVDRLRMKIVLSQAEPPPQCDPSPRRLPVVDTGSEQPGTSRRPPAIGTGSDEPGVSRAETQSTKRE